jgi:hypothetical protein
MRKFLRKKLIKLENSGLFNEFVRKLCLFWHEWTIKGPRVPKRPNLHKNELNTTYVFWFDEPLKSSKSLKIFKIQLTFRFDKL